MSWGDADSAVSLATSQQAGLAILQEIAGRQAAHAVTEVIPAARTMPMERVSPVPPPPARRRRGAARKASAWLRAAAFLITALALALPASPSGAQDVNRYGSPICEANGWTWLETVPRLQAHDSAGSCVEVDDKYRASMTVTRAPGNGSFPNISSGYELGLSGCPSRYDARHGLCLRYPVRVSRNWDPVASVKAWLAPGYQGNLAFDAWFSAKPGNTSFQARCSTVLSKADTEIMVWLAHPGDIAVPDTGRQYQKWIGGRRWKVDTWETFNHCPRGEGWRLVLIMAPRMTDGTVAVHNLRLDPFLSYAIRNGWLRDDEYLDAVDLGMEMDHGGTGNAIEGYTLRAGRQ